MSGLHATDVAPAWTWAVTAGSALLAALSFAVGSATGPVTTGATAVAAAGALYLLYRWGQRRERPSGDGDGDGRREKELEAEKGSYGGGGGG